MQDTRNRRDSGRTLTVCAAVGVWISTFHAGLALAQQPNAEQGQALARLGLESKPFTAEGLGLAMHMPAGAQVVAEKVNGSLVLAVSDDATTPTWTMRIQHMTSSLEDPSASGQVDDLLREFKTTGKAFKVISNDAVSYGGVAGQLCFLNRASPEGDPFIAGWLVLPNGPRTFLVLSIQTLAEHLPRMRPILEASFATIRLQNTEEIASVRKARLDAGQAFIDSISPERLRKHLGLKQWLRIHRSVAAPEKPAGEIGYALMEVLEARRGELNPERDPSAYDAAEREAGLMIRIQGRYTLNAKDYYDSIALYWMAWNQSEEAWSIRGTFRQGEAERTEAETGVRTPYAPGAPPPRLSVIKGNNDTRSRETFDWEVPEVYLSQPLQWLLARLLPTDINGPREYGWYFYNLNNSVSQRVDVWEPAADRSGNFKLTTRTTSDSPPTISIYQPDGTLVRRTNPDGSMSEPISPEELRKIWNSKGLQVGR